MIPAALGLLLSDDASWRRIFAINIPVGVLTVVIGAQILCESRARRRRRSTSGAPRCWPPPPAAWRWRSWRATTGAGRRPRSSGRSPRRSCSRRSWPCARAGTATFGAALFASQLCAVLFLTGVWGYSTLDAGLAAIPGALASAVAAPLGGRWASARGPRQPEIADALAFAAGRVWLVVAAGDRANFLGVWLPWGLVGGAGIGLGLPTLIGASAAGLPPTRFATGMALATTARQLGAVIASPCSSRSSAPRAESRTPSTPTTPAFARCAAAVLTSAMTALLLGRQPQGASVAGATPEPAIAPPAESARAA